MKITRVEAIHLRHIDVKQNQVRQEPWRQIKPFLAAAGKVQLNRLGTKPGLQQRVNCFGIIND